MPLSNDTGHSSRITMVKNGDETVALCADEPSDFLLGLHPQHIFLRKSFFLHSIEVPDRRLVTLHERQENTRLLVRPDVTRDSRFLFWNNTNNVNAGGRVLETIPLARAQHPWWPTPVQPMKPKAKREHERQYWLACSRKRILKSPRTTEKPAYRPWSKISGKCWKIQCLCYD